LSSWSVSLQTTQQPQQSSTGTATAASSRRAEQQREHKQREQQAREQQQREEQREQQAREQQHGTAQRSSRARATATDEREREDKNASRQTPSNRANSSVRLLVGNSSVTSYPATSHSQTLFCHQLKANAATESTCFSNRRNPALNDA